MAESKRPTLEDVYRRALVCETIRLRLKGERVKDIALRTGVGYHDTLDMLQQVADNPLAYGGWGPQADNDRNAAIVTDRIKGMGYNPIGEKYSISGTAPHSICFSYMARMSVFPRMDGRDDNDWHSG